MAAAERYKVTFYGSCPDCGQFSGKVEWSGPEIEPLREEGLTSPPEGHCGPCRRNFPLLWAQIRYRGKMIAEGDLPHVLKPGGDEA